MGLVATEVLPEAPPKEKLEKETPKKPTIALGDIPWVVTGLLLSFPTLFFALVHATYVPHKLPEYLDLPVSWALTFTGTFGPLMTVAALAVAVTASFQRFVSWQARVVLWSVGVGSCIAWMFIVNIPA
jgi:hypothetical protein